MKDKSSKAQRSMKKSTLFEFSSPPKAAPSTRTEEAPSRSKPKRKQASNPKSPRKSTQSKFPVTPRSSKKLPAKTYNISDSEDSSENIGRIKLQKKESTDSSTSSDSSDSSSNLDSDEVPRPTQARRLERLAAFVDREEEDDEDDAPKKPSTRSSKRRKTRAAKSSEEDSEEEVAPKRRRLTRSRKTPVAKGSGSEDEDVDDLDQEYVLETRLRERGKKSEFQRNLEKLRKRKLKQEVSSSEDEEEEDGESEEDSKPFKGAKQAGGSHGSLFGSNDSEDEDDKESESDFIVEDDGQVQLPAQFSMETHQDLQHQFKKIFQFFVHIAVQEPGVRRQFMEENLKNQEYFSVPLQITRRKFDGLRDSLVASSIWRPEFRKALERYPMFNLTHLDFAVNGCDACHLGSRISTLSGRLEGTPYDRLGFQPLKKEEKQTKQKRGKKRKKVEHDSDSGSNEQSLKKEFDLGRFCARRTQVYHEFSHWEYELFSGIEQELEDVRSQRAKKTNKQFYRVAYAGGKQPPEDLDDADALTDWLDERGIIEREWQRIRLIMDSARKLEMDGKKGGDLDTS